MHRADEGPHHSHCRAHESIVLMMIVQTIMRCWYLNMIFKLMCVIAGSAVVTIDAVVTIESFGWLDCKNIVHRIIFQTMLSCSCLNLILMFGFFGST